MTFGHLMIWYIACEATGGSSSDGHHMGLGSSGNIEKIYAI